MEKIASRIVCGLVLGLRPIFFGIDMLHKALGELLLAYVSDEDWDKINLRLYSRLGQYRESSLKRGLFRWEKQAIQNHFPKSPARVLVCAAGSGREMIELAKLGYRVSGFEQVDKFVRIGTKHIPGDALEEFVCGNFRDFYEGRLPSFKGPYDAVIIGWGAFSHLASLEEAKALLCKIKSVLSPEGVVLISFMRIHQAGPRRLWLRRLLGSLYGAKQRDDAYLYEYQVGLARGTRRNELDKLAAEAGYRVDSFDTFTQSSHAVLRLN